MRRRDSSPIKRAHFRAATSSTDIPGVREGDIFALLPDASESTGRTVVIFTSRGRTRVSFRRAFESRVPLAYQWEGLLAQLERTLGPHRVVGASDVR